MKKILAAALAVLMLLSLTACGEKKAATDSEALKAKGKVVVGITDFAPMDYRDENGNWTGFDAELAEAVFGKMGMKAEFTEIDWDNKILELDGGSIDCVWNGMTLTDEVKNGMSCTKPYVLNAQVVVMKADAAAQYPDADSISGLNFAVEAGSAGDLTAQDYGFANITQVAAQANALMEVAAGTSDACVIDLTMADAMTGEGTSYPDLTVAVELTNEEYGIGFRKTSDMAEKVNAILDEMMADGSLQELADKYGLSLIK